MGSAMKVDSVRMGRDMKAGRILKASVTKVVRASPAPLMTGAQVLTSVVMTVHAAHAMASRVECDT